MPAATGVGMWGGGVWGVCGTLSSRGVLGSGWGLFGWCFCRSGDGNGGYLLVFEVFLCSLGGLFGVLGWTRGGFEGIAARCQGVR